MELFTMKEPHNVTEVLTAFNIDPKALKNAIQTIPPQFVDFESRPYNPWVDSNFYVKICCSYWAAKSRDRLWTFELQIDRLTYKKSASFNNMYVSIERDPIIQSPNGMFEAILEAIKTVVGDVEVRIAQINAS